MPIIYRHPAGKPGSLNDVPLDWDKNRVEISATSSKLQKASLAVCTFVDKKYLSQKPNKDYRLTYTRTQEQRLRLSAVHDAKIKRKELIDLFDLTPAQKQAAELELAAFHEWAKDATKVASKFNAQISPGSATGFSIGNGLVVTAGHCVTDSSDALSNSYAVFGMTVEMVRSGTFPASAVFEVKRVVQSAFADDYDNPYAARTSPLQPVMNVMQWTRKGVNYDCAVIELNRVPKSSLSMRQAPVVAGLEVSLVGSPRGLPLKCSKGGHILKAIDLVPVNGPNQPARPPGEVKVDPTENATFTADVDSFGGNSGGPLLEDSSLNVVGITRSGAKFPFADSSLSSSATPPGLNTNLWARIQVLTKEAKKKAQDLNFPIAKDGYRLGADIDASWLYGYDQTRLSDDGKHLYQTRFPADSAIIRNLNRFTRVDALSFFTSSVNNFQHPAHMSIPGGHVSLSIELVQFADNEPMSFHSSLQLRIQKRFALAETHAITPGALGWGPDDVPAWHYSPLDPPAQQTAQIVYPANAHIPHRACHWPMGVSDWTSIEVVRTDKTHWQDTPTIQDKNDIDYGKPDMEKQAFLRILVQFKRLADQSASKLWGEELFSFDLDLPLETMKIGYHSTSHILIGHIGSNIVRHQSIWKGPRTQHDAVAKFW